VNLLDSACLSILILATIEKKNAGQDAVGKLILQSGSCLFGMAADVTGREN
jgi:hypothetical protein